MKNFFNAEDRTTHIIVTAMQNYLRKLTESQTLTNDERTRYKTALTHIEKANGSVFDRLGSAYVDRVLSETKNNDLRLVPKCIKSERTMMSYVTQEQILSVLNKARYLWCDECEDTCWKECPIYQVGVKTDLETRNNDDGCPFNMTM